jgi:hypothetical protein
MLSEVVPIEQAFAFGGAPATDGQQPREPAIGGSVGRPHHDRWRVAQMKLGANDQRQPAILRRAMRTHHTSQRVAVGHGKRRVAGLGRASHQLVRVRCALQK